MLCSIFPVFSSLGFINVLFLFAIIIIIGQAQNLTIVAAQNDVIEEDDNPNNDATTNNKNHNIGNNNVLLWSSTGGGWRAMFADIGYANVFQRAGIMGDNFTNFDSVASVSGGSWFSTQLFYSEEFYNQTVLARSPKVLEEFVLQWMGTYYNISSNFSNETLTKCDKSDVNSDDPNYDPDNEPSDNIFDLCTLLEEYNHDWAYFIDIMLTAASTEYGDPNFTSLKMSPTNRHASMQQTDLLIQAALMPNSRIRYNETNSTTGIYLGYDDDEAASSAETSSSQTKLFTVPLSFAVVVDDSGTKFVYGTDDITNDNSKNDDLSGSGLNTYSVDNTPSRFSWQDWSPFYLSPGSNGKITISSNDIIIGDTPVNKVGGFRTPFNGSDQTTIIQAASISSAAGGPYSPLNPSVYAHTFSIGYYMIEEARLATVWRVLAGLAVGLFVGVIIGYLPLVFCKCRDDDENKETIRIIMIVSGVCCGIIVACLTGVYVGVGSILIPTAYDNGVESVYENPDFDAFAVCSQWPFPCGEQDSMIIDGWLVDNPALVINIGHHQQKYGFGSTNSTSNNHTLKVIITNTNQKWDDDDWVHAQIMQYFSTYFNKDVPPGGFVWGPGFYAPYRSPQIFQEYMGTDDIDALIEPIEGSNMTTARLNGITIDNPSFAVYAGQKVEILLLNLNEDITTLVVGKDNVQKYTQPLADMTRHIASNQELVVRVRNFVES